MGEFLSGVFFALVAVVIFWRTMHPCAHKNTEYVTKCIDCGKVFNDGISELRKLK